VLLRLLALATHVWLRLLGFHRLRRRIGDWKVVFYRMGRGAEPFVLLHGLGSNALSWSPVARRLAKTSRLLVPELSTIGGTRGPRPALDVASGPRVLAELLRRELAGEPATIVGLSLGGWLAVRLALEEPSLVSRLILIDAAGYREQDWEAIRSLVTVESDEDVDRLYAALFRRVPRVFRFSRAGFRRIFSSPAVTSLVGVEGALGEADLYGAEDLARLHVPVGVIWAEHDGLFDAAVGREMAGNIPGARFYLVPGAGHGLHWEAPDALLAALDACRRDLPALARPPVARVEPAAAAAGARSAAE
jgi:pimeloyl-ACP methyl ester carboxylesterase